jgi:hypothetical protein
MTRRVVSAFEWQRRRESDDSDEEEERAHIEPMMPPAGFGAKCVGTASLVILIASGILHRSTPLAS